jgi:hypothetical protein
MEYCKTCDVWQAVTNKYVVHTPLHPIPPLGAFEKWGIDSMGPLPVTPQANKFVVVATNYLTKWAEVRPLKAFKKQEVARFVYKKIMRHFGDTCLDDFKQWTIIHQ